MKPSFTIIISLFTGILAFSQEEASFWFFGQRAGVQFNNEAGTATGISVNQQINTLEGCTTISDTNGNLLFYSDGITVWNRNHQIMPNGTGLKGDPSSTSSGLIVPKPQDPNFYYIFTVDEPHHFNTSAFPNNSDGDGVNEGLMYSRVNMTENGGLGVIDNTLKNVPLITYDISNPLEASLKCSEKITAVRADDCSSIWVITHFVDKFYAFKVDENGVDTNPVESESGIDFNGPIVPANGYRRNALGYMKASPDGSKLVLAHQGFANNLSQDAPGGVYLYDFNNDTGKVTNTIELYSPANGNSPYGVEFSSENTKVYATIGGGIGGGGNGQFSSQIIQWDLEATDIENSGTVVHTSQSLSSGALQLAIDNKIYRAQLDFNALNNGAVTGRYIGAIENPDSDAQDIIYNDEAILVDINGSGQNLSRIGLPPFIQSLFNSKIDIIRNDNNSTQLDLCEGESYVLQADEIPSADYLWSKDGSILTEDANGIPLTSSSFQLVIRESGFYEVFIDPNNGECPIEGEAIVQYSTLPEAYTPTTPIEVCDNEDNNGIFIFNSFDQLRDEILGNGQSSLDYSIRYFTSSNDANIGENEITFPYENQSNPQEIFVRVENRNNPDCYRVTDTNTGLPISFLLDVFDTPEIEMLQVTELCDTDGDTTDGVITITLTDFNEDILGSQDANNHTITYHATQNDADNNANELPSDYDTNPFNDEIFVRIENDSNQACYATERISLTINPTPIANDASIFQCDEDGVPDGLTIFNLNQVSDTITNAAPNSTVMFYENMADAISETNPLDANNYSNTNNPQTVIARVNNTTTLCFSFSELSLEASVTSANDAFLRACDDDGDEDGFADFVLSNADQQVLDGLPTGLDLMYYKSYEDALLEQHPLPNNYRNEQEGEQVIYVRVENDNNCFGINKVTLQVIGLPNVEPFFETLYCLNTFPEPIVLNGGVINDIPNNYYYDWDPTGETTIEIEVNEPGTYTVIVRNVLGCSKERTILVNASSTATVEDVLITDASENNTVTILLQQDQTDYEYSLNSPLGPYQDSNTFQNVRPGFYTVYIRDLDGCGVTEHEISVIGFPKFFTPNGDGQNDFWRVKGISRLIQAGTQILIFDKLGKLIAELDPTSSGWDGTYNGNPMPTSDYWFSVTLEDGRPFAGHFSLKR